MNPPASGPPGSVAITGASGFIGSALAESLETSGTRVVRLVRRPSRGPNEAAWNPEAGTVETERLEGLDAVVHLAGSEMAVRWTEDRKKVIRNSRIHGTHLIATSLAGLEQPPRVLVSGSGIGYYGDRGDERLDEESTAGTGFLASVAREWEEAAAPAAAAGVRVVLSRTGLVVGPGGGLLERMLLPFKLGVGGALGSGRQWMSWISLEDTVRAIRFAIANDALRGPVNTVAPEPVTNAEFTRALASALGRPALLKVPPIALRAMFGEMADAMILASQRAVPRRLLDAGFDFRHRRLEDALGAALAGAR